MVLDLKLDSTISLSNGTGFGNNITFDADMSLLVHIGNNKKDILILGKGPKNSLDDTMMTAERKNT